MIDPDELERWLLAVGFAVSVGGLLVATERTVELAGAIEP
jgi:hypothetical protein